MRFCKLDEVPVSGDDVVFQQSPVRSAIIAVLFLGVGIAAITCAVVKWPDAKSATFFYFLGGFLSLIGLAWVFNFRSTLKASNWLLRCKLGSLFVHYRAYENWRLPADAQQVVGFEYGEIAWAKLVKERRTQPSSDPKYNSETVWLTHIALSLANPDTTELDAKLQTERNLRPNGVLVSLDFPVQVQPGGIVEVRWNAGIRPSAKKALVVLGQRIKILETEHRVTDLTHRASGNPEDAKAKILALAKSGDEMGAVRLAQQVYGYNLTQATQFVEKLTGQDD
jgi:hypothetical protein